ncbi:glycosyltransferase family 2 protein [Kaistella pullorum]|uniref:Glycosyltransferase n=1 Tax=Kaistella pullorum TaxID=2763074 RepID=A0ABR8WIW6_9FLAO|nr:glycosyltransferase family 2 protein [Kaistella pullorum]MBD8016999.1 glycosyltransferase [Kaistella pullorum]
MAYQETISVIVPVYNVEKYLVRCLQSILNQTYSNIEVILINDGSTDGSLIICQEFAIVDERIVVINKSNGGSSSARNAGLALATGDYISFVDSDDYISPQMLEILLNNLRFENADISECGVYHTSTKIAKMTSNKIYTVDKESWLLNVIEKSEYAVWRRLYKKEILENKKFKVGFIYEDVFFLYDILDRINKIVKTSEKLYFYCDENSSIMRSDFSEKNINVIVASKYQYDFVTTSRFKNNIKVMVGGIYKSDLANTFCNLSYYPNYDRNKKVRKIIRKELNTLPYSGILTFLIRKLPVRLSSYFINIRKRFRHSKFKLSF